MVENKAQMYMNSPLNTALLSSYAARIVIMKGMHDDALCDTAHKSQGMCIKSFGWGEPKQAPHDRYYDKIACTHVCTYVCMYVCMCNYVCVCVAIHSPRSSCKHIRCCNGTR